MYRLHLLAMPDWRASTALEAAPAGFLITLLLISGLLRDFHGGRWIRARRQRRSPYGCGIWSPNVLTVVLGLFLLTQDWSACPGSSRQQAPPSGLDCRLAHLEVVFTKGMLNPRQRLQNDKSRQKKRHLRQEEGPQPGIPQLLDMYLLHVLSSTITFCFLRWDFWCSLKCSHSLNCWRISRQHRTNVVGVIIYFVYLACYLFCISWPAAALVAVLVTLGVMTKNNELVAFKASGLSLYRIALPLLLGGIFLAAGLLALDDTYLPFANQRQDALRNQIKGRPAQASLPTQPAMDLRRESPKSTVTTSFSIPIPNCSAD